MMDTVLNLGLNDATVEGLARRLRRRRFAYDSYRRFIQMYSDVVLGVEHHRFEDMLEEFKDDRGVVLDTELDAETGPRSSPATRRMVEERAGRPFPQDVNEQLWGAIGAVFKSWKSARAVTYRRLHGIPEDWGTAVSVQAMVFGNMGETSATGVAFTRNPSTGERALLWRVSGQCPGRGCRRRHPHAAEHHRGGADRGAGSDAPSLERLMPETFGELTRDLRRARAPLPRHAGLEFTIERGRLWMLQTRSGKRTAKAALKIAVDMADEGLISRDEAVARIDPASLDQLLHPTLDPKAKREMIAQGLPASPGAASGAIVFDPDEAEKRAGAGQKVILVRVETSPEDIHGMHAAEGILTTRGGMT